MLNGDFIAATPIYGYTKQDDGSWAIDPIATDVIKRIFKDALQGRSAGEIAETLSAAGIPMPREHIKLTRGDDIKPSCKWKAQNVRNIFKNIQYTGAYVSGKILTDKSGVKYHTAQEDWIVIPDKHPAIVSNDLFEQVQLAVAECKKSLQKKKKPRNYLLRSKVRCGCCGNAMSYDPVTIPVFRCFQTASGPSAPCHKMKVIAGELDEAVLDIIRKQAEVILNTDDLHNLQKTNGNAQQIADCDSRMKALVTLRQNYYEQFVTGEIDRKTHQSLKADCTAQVDRLNNQIAMLRQSEHDSRDRMKTATHAKTVLSESITEKQIVDMLIESIHVFPDDRLEIKWKVAGFAAGI